MAFHVLDTVSHLILATAQEVGDGVVPFRGSKNRGSDRSSDLPKVRRVPNDGATTRSQVRLRLSPSHSACVSLSRR